MSFFSQFPKLSYDFNRTGTTQQMVNIFRSVRSQSAILNRSTLYKKYIIQAGMRPDIISEKLYGTPDYYWTFFIINDFLHDGLQAWPMSESTLQQYLKTHYNGKALIFTPVVTGGETKNSIAGKLDLGALIYGIRSGAVGRIVRKDVDLNLIVVQDIIDGVEGRNPQTGQTDESILGGGFRTDENIQSTYIRDNVRVSLATGNDVTNSLKPDHIYEYAEAPAYYYIEGDPDEKPVTSHDSMPPQNAQASPIFSEIQWDTSLQAQVANYSDELLNQPLRGDGDFILTNTVVEKPLISSGGYEPNSDVDVSNTITFKSNRQHIIEKNDLRSNIKVIKPEFINEFVEEFERIINV